MLDNHEGWRGVYALLEVEHSIEPTDEHREFAESMLDGEAGENGPSRAHSGSDGTGGVA